MSYDWRRWKTWDYVVLVLFVLTIIGVSLTWWSLDMGGAASSAMEAAGISQEAIDATGIDLSALVAEAVPEYSVSAHGVDFDSVVFCLVLAILAALVVLAKPLFPVDKELPKWYMEALVIMVFGAIITFITFLRLAVAPEGGHSAWNPGAGGFITLIAGLVMLGAGYMMWKNKTGDYGKSVLPKITTGSNTTPPAGTPPTY
jgi:hypothetical protein